MNLETIQTAFAGLVGWRDDGTLTPELTASESGLRYQAAHPLLTLDNLRAIAPKGEDFNTWLQTETEAAVLSALLELQAEGTKDKQSRPLADYRRVFERYAQPLPDTSTTARRLGVMIECPPVTGAVMLVREVYISADAPVGSLDLRVFKTGQAAPVRTVTLDRSVAGSEEAFALVDPIRLRLDGSKYFIVYDTAQLGGQPLVLGTGWRAVKCGRDLAKLTPITVAGAHTGALWPAGAEAATGHDNGFGLSVSVELDPAELLADNKLLVARLVQLSVAAAMLRTMAYNPSYNLNRTQQNLGRNEILYELDGDSSSPKLAGLGHQKRQAVQQAVAWLTALMDSGYALRRPVKFGSI